MQTQTVVDSFSLERIVPYFQPVFNLHNHKVVRYECLSRLISKDEKVFLPSEFLYIVSKNKATAMLTKQMLAMSSAYCMPRQMSWSVNMFASDLKDFQLVQWMKELCEELHNDSMGVEISLEHASQNFPMIAKLNQTLPYLHITIDDVHCYNEIVEDLVESGVRALKLRGSCISNLTNKNADKTWIHKLLALCKANNCLLIAEHIENEQTLKAVLDTGITLGQGYYLSEPEARIIN